MAGGFWQSNVPGDVREPPKIDASVPNVARGATGYLDARGTGTMLAAAAELLDFSEQVAVMLEVLV